MFEIKVVSKSLQPLKDFPEIEPFQSEAEALIAAGKILFTFGSKMQWMKILDPLYTSHLFEQPNCVGVYSGDKDICVVICPLVLTDEEDNRLPTNKEVGPYR